MAAVGFMGLGAMGHRMAARLLKAGHTLTVYNRTPAAASALQAQGATLAQTPREVAQRSDVIFSMVRDDEASQDIWLNENNGATHGLKPGSIAVECSTLSPTYIRQLAHRINKTGAAFLDAPVAGSRPQAEAGQLIFLVGGQAVTLEAVHPLLLTMGTGIHHAGPNGNGATLKLAVNSLFAIQVAALAETLRWLKKEGISNADAVAIFNTLPTTSPALQGIGKLIATENDSPLFTIDLVAKDLRYATSIATSDTSPLLVDTARQLFEHAVQQGLGESNITAIRKR